MTHTARKKTVRRRAPSRNGERGGQATRRRAGGRATNDRAGGRATNDRAGGRRQTALRHVKLRIHKITCVDDTRELDKDEIVLTAIRTELTVREQRGNKTIASKSKRGKKIDAGKFKGGSVKTFSPPETIAKFPIGAASAEWPRYYPVTLLLIETDRGDVAKIVRDVIDAVDDEVTQAVGTAAGAAAGAALAGAVSGGAAGSVVPVVGTAIGAAVGTAVGAALGAIGNSRADEVFPPKQLVGKVQRRPTAAGRIGDKKTWTVSAFGGKYKVVYSWSAS